MGKNKKMFYFLTLLLVTIVPNASNADEMGCFPVNTLKFSKYQKTEGLTKRDYLTALEKVKLVFDPFLKAQFNKELMYEDRWDLDEVNAFCTRDNDNNPLIKINGGLVRHPSMTQDSLLLLICHELGHFMGGAPKAFRGRTKLRGWSSAEGQADYFASSKCLPRLLREKGLGQQNLMAPDIRKSAQEQCLVDPLLCTQIAVASYQLAQVFHSVRPFEEGPDFYKEDSSVVNSTFYGHPRAQCRLDTFVRGANCLPLIEIPFDPKDPNIGACLLDSDDEDLSRASRPRCWYSPAE